MIVQWLDEAFADLDRIFDYILERNPEAALKVYEAIRQTALASEGERGLQRLREA